MKSFLSAAIFAASASAAALQVRATSGSCCFGITVNGGHQNGSLGQLDDGQNRVGPGFGGASFCLTGTTITDASGRGCVIAMPQTQFQCDLNGTPTPGFSVTSSGLVAYEGNTTFYECAATADMQFNIYTTPYESYCAAVTLSVTGNTCNTSSNCSAVTSTTTQVSVSTVTASVVSTLPAATVTHLSTVAGTCAASTIYQTQTVTASVVSTLPATTVTHLSTVAGTCAASTIYQTQTVTVTGAGNTVVQTASGQTVTKTAQGTTIIQTVTQTAPGTTLVQTVTQTASGTTITVTQTAPGTTATQTTTQTAPGTTVVQTSTTASTPTTTSTPLSTTSTPSSTTTTSTSTSTACPANLSGSYQYPHLIIPINSTSPSTAYGTQYNGTVTPTVSTIFNFDIPSSYAGETCSLIFLLPYLSELETSSYSLTGTGGIEVLELSSPATASTTYNNAPSVLADLGTISAQAGSSTVIATSTCAAGETVAYELKATGSYALEFFQDWNPSPLGLYVRAC